MPFGSGVREFLVELDPAALVQARFSVEDVVTALDEASAAPAAGFHVDRGQEYLVRGLGRFIDVAIRNVTLALRDGANAFRRLRP